MGAVRENQASAHSSGKMGTGICLARQQPTAVSTANTSDFTVLWDFGFCSPLFCYRRSLAFQSSLGLSNLRRDDGSSKADSEPAQCEIYADGRAVEIPVRTENLIRVDDVMESPKLAE
jgi:hypothetical protein